eukprot:729932-Hanusia_phi.AAC.1
MASRRLLVMALAAALAVVEAGRQEEGGRSYHGREGARRGQGERRGGGEEGWVGSDGWIQSTRQTRLRSGIKLPAHISACYADWQECDSQVLTAAKQMPMF